MVRLVLALACLSGAVCSFAQQPGTGAIRNTRTNQVVEVDSRQSGLTGGTAFIIDQGRVPPSEGIINRPNSVGAPSPARSDDVLAQAMRMMRSSNTDDRAAAAKLFRHVYPALVHAENSRR